MSNLGRDGTPYNEFYYRHCCGTSYERSPQWLGFFGRIADRLISDIAPATVLDVGCAMGFLVESLRDRGVEAYGLDISEYALGLVRKDIQAYCWKGSASDNLCRRYDLIVCIEVLEHMTPEQAEQAVVNFCRWTDDVVFSSTPDDFGEASHINVRPIEYWSDLFARFGFVRDLSFDASFIAPHARRFRKADGPLFKQLGRYEQVLARVERAEFSVRQRLMGTQTQLQQTESRLEEALAQIVDGQKRLDLTQNQLEMAQTALANEMANSLSLQNQLETATRSAEEVAAHERAQLASAHRQISRIADRLDTETSELLSQIHHLEEDVATASDTVERAKRHILQLESSFSWRITRPLRTLRASQLSLMRRSQVRLLHIDIGEPTLSYAPARGYVANWPPLTSLDKQWYRVVVRYNSKESDGLHFWLVAMSRQSTIQRTPLTAYADGATALIRIPLGTTAVILEATQHPTRAIPTIEVVALPLTRTRAALSLLEREARQRRGWRHVCRLLFRLWLQGGLRAVRTWIFGLQQEPLESEEVTPVSTSWVTSHELLCSKFRDTTPIGIYNSPRETSRRLTIVTDSINSGSLFGGVATSMIIGTLLAEKLKASIRVVTRTEKAHQANFFDVLRAVGIPAPPIAEFLFVPRERTNADLSIADQEMFLTTSWWTTEAVANSARNLRVNAKIVYLVQEDERLFYPAGDEYVRAQQTLNRTDIYFLVNTQLLWDHLSTAGFVQLRHKGVWFEPAFPAALYYYNYHPLEVTAKRRLLVYARPMNPRNAFYMALNTLERAISRNVFNPSDWDISFVGSHIPPIVLSNGYIPILHQDLSLQDYAALVRSTDVGLSLMLTPHPSYPPLDLAASGALVVTNRFGIKQSLDSYSRNILCCDPNPESLVDGLAAAVALSQNAKERLARYSANILARDWRLLSPRLDELLQLMALPTHQNPGGSRV